MSITGRFEADFASFFAACQQAEVRLNGISGAAKNVERQLDQAVDSFSGRQIVNEATLMVGAVQGIGGVAKLTDDELGRVVTTVEAAIAKMKLMGADVPVQFEKIVSSAKQTRSAFAEMDQQYQHVTAETARAVNAFGDLDRGLSSVDKTLGLLGVNIGPQLQALRELSAVSGSSATALGTLGTAGAVVGTLVASWSFGRMIAEFFDLDKSIADSVASFMGWGDVAAEEAAAGADVLARASAAVGRDVTTMTEAMRINEMEAQKLAGVHKQAATEMSAAWKAARAEYEAWDRDVSTIEERLLGNDAVEKANRYRAALDDITAQGLKPMRSQMQEVVDALAAAIQAMKETDRTGTLMYRNMVAEHDKYAAKLALLPGGLLPSKRVNTGASGVPFVGPGGDVSDAVHQAEMESWLERVEQDWVDIEANARKYYEMQGVLFDDTEEGANRATKAFDRWRQSVNALAQSMSQSQWLSAKPAELSATQYLNTPGPALQALRGTSAPISVTVNAQNSFYDTPSSLNTLANKVGDAVLNQIRVRGGTVR